MLNISSCTRLAEAALSLQAAAGQFLLEGNHCTRRPKNVVLKSSCEIDKECQLVLRNTFGHCNYPDVTCVDFQKNKGSFCTTHQRCCPQAQDDPTRTWLRSCNLTWNQWENWCLESCPDYLVFLDCRLPDRSPTCQKVSQDCKPMTAVMSSWCPDLVLKASALMWQAKASAMQTESGTAQANHTIPDFYD